MIHIAKGFPQVVTISIPKQFDCSLLKLSGKEVERKKTSVNMIEEKLSLNLLILHANIHECYGSICLIDFIFNLVNQPALRRA